jgi:hypothetical protein
MKIITIVFILSLLFLVGCGSGVGIETIYEVPESKQSLAADYALKLCAEGASTGYANDRAKEMFGVAVYTLRNGEIIPGSDRRDRQPNISDETTETIGRSRQPTSDVQPVQSVANIDISSLKAEILLLKTRIESLENSQKEKQNSDWMKK